MKITVEAYAQFLTEVSPHPDLRWGQRFCIRFKVTDPEIFYERDAKVARRKAEKKYLPDVEVF